MPREDSAKKQPEKLYTETSCLFLSLRNPVRRACIGLVENKLFEGFILLVILVNCIFLGVSEPTKGPHEGRNKVINGAEMYLTATFSLEAVIKIIALGFIKGGPYMTVAAARGLTLPRAAASQTTTQEEDKEIVRPPYLRDSWNILDFFVVSLSWAAMLPGFKNYTSIRTVRVLRPLRAITVIPGMRVLVGAILKSIPMIGNIILLLLFFFVIAGVVGVQLYAGKLQRRCQYSAAAVASGAPLFSNRVCQVEARMGLFHGHTCPADMPCAVAGNPNYGVTSFDNFLLACVTIFQVITLEGWTFVMYDAMDGAGWTAMFYFIAIVVFGSFFLINLMLGVITETYAEAVKEDELEEEYQEELEEARKDEEQRAAAETSASSQDGDSSAASDRDEATRRSSRLQGRIAAFMSLRRPTYDERELSEEVSGDDDKSSDNMEDAGMVYLADDEDDDQEQQPELKLKSMLKAIAMHPVFHVSSLILVLANLVVLMLQHNGMSAQFDRNLRLADNILTYMFAAEITIKILGYGLNKFLRDKLNRFDLVVVVLNVIELLFVSESNTISALRTVRVFRILKLLQQWTSLQVFLRVLMHTLTELGNMTVIVLITIFIFALIGMEMFGGKMAFEEGVPRHNFDTLPWALISVFQILTGEDWNSVMYDGVRAAGSHWAAVYFITAVLVGNYLVLNLFLAVLLSPPDSAGSYSDVSQGEEHDLKVLKRVAARAGRWTSRVATRVRNYVALKRLRRGPPTKLEDYVVHTNALVFEEVMGNGGARPSRDANPNARRESSGSLGPQGTLRRPVTFAKMLTDDGGASAPHWARAQPCVDAGTERVSSAPAHDRVSAWLANTSVDAFEGTQSKKGFLSFWERRPRSGMICPPPQPTRLALLPPQLTLAHQGAAKRADTTLVEKAGKDLPQASTTTASVDVSPKATRSFTPGSMIASVGARTPEIEAAAASAVHQASQWNIWPRGNESASDKGSGPRRHSSYHPPVSTSLASSRPRKYSAYGTYASGSAGDVTRHNDDDASVAPSSSDAASSSTLHQPQLSSVLKGPHHRRSSSKSQHIRFTAELSQTLGHERRTPGQPAVLRQSFGERREAQQAPPTPPPPAEAPLRVSFDAATQSYRVHVSGRRLTPAEALGEGVVGPVPQRRCSGDACSWHMLLPAELALGGRSAQGTIELALHNSEHSSAGASGHSPAGHIQRRHAYGVMGQNVFETPNPQAKTLHCTCRTCSAGEVSQLQHASRRAGAGVAEAHSSQPNSETGTRSDKSSAAGDGVSAKRSGEGMLLDTLKRVLASEAARKAAKGAAAHESGASNTAEEDSNNAGTTRDTNSVKSRARPNFRGAARQILAVKKLAAPPSTGMRQTRRSVSLIARAGSDWTRRGANMQQLAAMQGVRDNLEAVRLGRQQINQNMYKRATGVRLDQFTGKSLGLFSKGNRLRRFAFSVVDDKRLEFFILVCIMASSVTLALDAPGTSGQMKRTINTLDYMFTAIFSAELLLKVIAMGFVIGEHSYLRNAWNTLDFFTVSSSWLSLIFSGVNVHWLRTLRTLRVLRPLRLVSRIPELKIVVNAIFAAIPGMGHVLMVTMIFYIIFGIVGIQLMMGKFYSCSASTCCSDILDSSTCVTVDTQGDCVGFAASTGDSCAWLNADSNFDNIYNALLTLFEMSTTEGWTSVMYMGIDARGIGMQPKRDHQPLYAMYFVAFMIVGNFLLLNMFVGIIMEKFSSVRQGQPHALSITPEQAAWVEAQRRALRRMPSKRYAPPSSPTRRWVLKKVDSQSFEACIMVCILLATTTLALEHHNMAPEWKKVLMPFEISFNVLFTLEAAVKLYALGRRGYFAQRWNTFDLVIVVLNWAGMFNLIPTGSSALRILRLLRFLRLMRTLKGVQTLLTTLVMSIPTMLNVAGLMMLLFFIFATLGVNLFGNIQFPNEHPRASFRNFGSAMLMLMRMVTGEAWNAIMHQCMIRPPECDDAPEPYCVPLASLTEEEREAVEHDAEACAASGSMWVDNVDTCGTRFAPIYFLLFVALGSFLMLNLVIAVLLENFSISLQSQDEEVTEEQLTKFRVAWSKHDPDASGKLTLEKVEKLLLEVPVPLGLKGTAPHVPRRVMIQFLESLELPMGEDGTVQYHNLLLAMSCKAVNLNLSQLPTVMQDKLRAEIALLQRQTAGPTAKDVNAHNADANAARTERSAGASGRGADAAASSKPHKAREIHIGEAYAARILQAAIRGHLVRKRMHQERAERAATAQMERSVAIAGHINDLLDQVTLYRTTGNVSPTTTTRLPAYLCEIGAADDGTDQSDGAAVLASSLLSMSAQQQDVDPRWSP